MVDAVVQFVKRKQPRFVRSVKILIFQTAMLKHFHMSMKKRQKERVQEKSVVSKTEGITLFFNLLTINHIQADALFYISSSLNKTVSDEDLRTETAAVS